MNLRLGGGLSGVSIRIADQDEGRPVLRMIEWLEVLRGGRIRPSQIRYQRYKPLSPPQRGVLIHDSRVLLSQNLRRGESAELFM